MFLLTNNNYSLAFSSLSGGQENHNLVAIDNLLLSDDYHKFVILADNIYMDVMSAEDTLN